MADDWIKMRMNLRTHPKVVRMASALSADRFRIIGGLHSVWCMVDEHSEDGYLLGYSAQALDESVGFPGLALAMQSVDWLLIDGKGVAIPEFIEHNGKSAKRRAEDTKRKKDVRGLSAKKSDKKTTREDKTLIPKGIKEDAAFEAAWLAYPKRSGNNPKADALKAWSARLTEGIKAEAMMAGVERYARWCQATDKVGTETVMQGARFFGPAKPYEQEFVLPRNGSNGHSCGAWWASDPGIIAKGKEVGLEPRKGESFADLKGRISVALEQRERQP